MNEFFTDNDYYNLKAIGSAIFCLAFIYGIMPLFSLIGKAAGKILEMGSKHIDSRMELLKAGDARPDYLSAKKRAAVTSDGGKVVGKESRSNNRK